MILLAILAPSSFTTSINYEDLETEATSGFHHYQEGGNEDRRSGHKGKYGDGNDVGYNSHHDFQENSKGHRDLNRHHESIFRNDDENEHRGHDDGFYDQHRESEEGENGDSFYKEGHYKKGYNIHGHHEVENIDEIKKHEEFHDEDYESDFDEYDGGHYYDYMYGNGGSHGEGRYDLGSYDGDYEKKGYHDNGYGLSGYKGYNGVDGHEDYYQNDYHQGNTDASGGRK
ncbi:histidine-rich glycoprotein-like [Hylaeus anthracinus]|uniref:histidine-rich glycoprotein-like n=1 Tax=Hylaeus anthracinus TaxID=313031 RepID=UPI0023B97268|nr:histidine-rich glycoprotein-like [Hylaeus anthracinus]